MTGFDYKQWLVENKVGPYGKKSLNESGHGDEPFDFNKAAIESASDDKISHTEEDDYGKLIYWSTKNPNVNYHIGNGDQIIKYDGETGERYPIGDLNHYDEPAPDSDRDTDADYEEPGEDFDMAEEVTEKITISLPENVDYKELAKAVADVLIEHYGEHNYKPFLQALIANLK